MLSVAEIFMKKIYALAGLVAPVVPFIYKELESLSAQ
jgi:hypothetical protein